MKKKAFLLAAMIIGIIASFTVLTGCSGQTGNKNARISIVTTVFPEYDWIRNVLGDELENVSVTMLLDSGVDLHSYQPTANDIVKISTADVFVYTGGESDEWVEDVLKEKINEKQIDVNLLEVLGERALDEEIVEGMEAEEETEEEEGTKDEHVWLSLKQAAYLTEKLADVFAEADPEYGEVYHKNADAYVSRLTELDEAYTAAVSGAKYKTLLFGDRFPFLYMVKDYGLNYYAAFSGCSAESEASFETVVFLADKMNELSLPAIITLEGTAHKIAETIKETAKLPEVKILTMDSLQAVTRDRMEKGADYIEIMKQNLEVLREALQ